MESTHAGSTSSISGARSVNAPGDLDTDVVIAGGGPVGLTLALELDRRGIRSVVVEPRSVVTEARARCKQLNMRTMEHFRRLGVAEELRRGSSLPQGWSDQAIFCTHLLGQHIYTFEDAFLLSPERKDWQAEPALWGPQYCAERTLRAVLERSTNVEMLLGSELRGFDQSEDGVRCSLSDAFGGRTVSGRYLVGCDGSRSTVRRALGIDLRGDSASYDNLAVSFRAPGLMQRNPHGPAVQYWTINDRAAGLCGNLDLQDTWWAILLDIDVSAPVSEVRAMVQAMIGEDLPIDILQLDPWTARMLIADRYRQGRVFLAGDAAHLNPPWGGWGANTGIGDAVDLGWKLAAVLQGWGGDGLLEHYETERRPVAARVIRDARANMQVLSKELHVEGLDSEDAEGEEARRQLAERIAAVKRPEMWAPGLILGQEYSSPLLVPDDVERPAESVTEFQPTLATGLRLPHGWSSDSRSLFDALGQEFTLLVLDDGVDVSPLVAGAVERRIPVTVVTIDDPTTAGVIGSPLVLVRPDQVVAWHGYEPSDVGILWDTVTGRCADARGPATPGASELPPGALGGA
jgi:2-polyprenyl-6-methoxyphenol hydroxylase-like FAD-dependent oxidoreductase